MSPIAPLERISAILSNAGYRRLASPLTIAGINFDIPLILVGTGSNPDLILVADTAFEKDAHLQKKVEGVARALDVMRSKRPLTVILAGPRPGAAALEAMAKVCRVLPVGTQIDSNEDETLRKWLSILLPLKLPTPTAELADPLAEVQRRLGTKSDPIVDRLLAAAPQGTTAVEQAFLDAVAEPIGDLGSEEAVQ